MMKILLGSGGLLIVVILILYLRSDTSTDRVVPPPSDAAAYSDILSYELDPSRQNLVFFSVDDRGSPFEHHGRLRRWLESSGQELVFAMNGGMFKADLSPQGLYIEDGVKVTEIDTVQNGYGNFYLQPNGIFWITESGKGAVRPTQQFTETEKVAYATQSGPMLVIDGSIHSAFKVSSQNLHIRNGVGILPDGHLLFALSKVPVNFYRLAKFFQDHGCEHALYLDGFVSRVYLPEQEWMQEDGQFGIIIAETRER